MRVTRRPVTLQADRLVNVTPSSGGRPTTVEPAGVALNLPAWIAAHQPWVQAQLLESGAVLFRRFHTPSTNDFEACVRLVCAELMEYSFASTPRTKRQGHVYTSTEYPPDQTIPMHSEMAYSRTWPLRVGFLCMRPAVEGGQTPLADNREVFRRVPEEIRSAFAARRVTYVRNYTPTLDVPWQRVFGTDDRDQVEAFCARAGIECEWRAGGSLQTRQVCDAVARHPVTGEAVWFNQVSVYHASALPASVSRALWAALPEDRLPRNCYYGDGGAIEPAVVRAIDWAYREASSTFDWMGGDVLMLDNMLVAHGRRPFTGEREVLVAMGARVDAHDPAVRLPAVRDDAGN